MYTQKQDWLNDYLSNNNYFVSDHDSYRKSLGLNSSFKVSLRFFGNRAMGYTPFLAINYVNSDFSYYFTEDVIKSITHNVREHLERLSNAFQTDVDVIIFSDAKPNYFILIKSNSVHKLSGIGLCQYFSSINKELVRNIGDAKQMNISNNDSFQIWTRLNLSRFIVVNDIDAYCLIKQDGCYDINILELKRPQESCETWLPYCRDQGNYNALKKIQQSSDASVLTICYNDGQDGDVSVFDIQSADKYKINGMVFRGKINCLDLKTFCLDENYEFKNFSSNR